MNIQGKTYVHGNNADSDDAVLLLLNKIHVLGVDGETEILAVQAGLSEPYNATLAVTGSITHRFHTSQATLSGSEKNNMKKQISLPLPFPARGRARARWPGSRSSARGGRRREISGLGACMKMRRAMGPCGAHRQGFSPLVCFLRFDSCFEMRRNFGLGTYGAA